MRKRLLTSVSIALILLMGAMLHLHAQPITDAQGSVGIGTLGPGASAKLEVASTSKGFLIPRMTTAQRNAIVSPAASLLIYNLDVGDFQYWDANTAQWETFVTTANFNLLTWRTVGNSTLTPWNGVNGHFLGMQDNVDLVLKTENAQMQFWTSNTERARFDAAGNFYPATDNAYTLGTNANRWQDIYANGGSVHIGPSGGEGVSELQLGYGAGTASLNVDGAASEIDVTVANTNVNNNLNVGLNLDVTGITTLNSAVALGDAAADAINLNGTLTGLGSGHSLGSVGTDAQVLTINGDANNVGSYEMVVNGDAQITGVLSLPGLNPNAVIVTDGAGNVITDTEFTYDATTNVLNVEGTVQNAAGDLALDDNVDVSGVLDAQSAGNLAGDGTASRQLTVEGSADAVIGNTVAGNPTVWDQVVEGDFAATGLIKAGGSLWFDGITPGNHQVVANDALNLGTTNGNNLTLSTNGTNAIVVDAGTQNVNILQDVDVDGNGNVDGTFNVVGPATAQSTLEVDGITTLHSNLNVDGPTDLNSTLGVDGAVTINNTITQTGGGQVTFSGNVDADNGLDVSGQDLTVGGANFIVDVTNGNTTVAGTITGNSAGNVLGNNANNTILTVDGDGGGALPYEFIVDGDAQINGLLSFGSFTPGSVVFIDGANNLAENNPDFFWDNANSRLGIGTAGAPNAGVHSISSGGTAAVIGENPTGIATAGLSNSSDGLFGQTITGRGVVANSTGAGVGLFVNSVNGPSAVVVNAVPANASTTLEVSNAGTGTVIDVNMINAASAADAVTVDEIGTGDAISITEADAGVAIDIDESGAGPGIRIQEGGAGDGITIIEGGVGNGMTINANGAGLGLEVNGGAVDGNAAGNEFGDGTAIRQLNVLGVADAVIGHTIVGDADVWDQLITGDLGVTGIIKSGGSIWIDGVNDEISASGTLIISTDAEIGGDIVLNASTLDIFIEDNLFVENDVTVARHLDFTGATSTISNSAFGAIGFADDLTLIDGADIIFGNGSLMYSPGEAVTVNDDLAVTAGNVTITNGGFSVVGNATLGDAAGDQHTTNGNMDVTNGVDVTGGDLTVGSNFSVVTGANSRVVANDAHVRSTQTTAPVAAVAGANVTSAVLSNATDVAGSINITTSGAAGVGAQATITFDVPYGTAPIVNLTPASALAPGVGAYVTRTTNGFTISFMGLPANSTSYEFFYQVIETQ